MATDSIVGAGLVQSPYREAAERIEQLERDIAEMRRERDAAFAMSRCECGPDECCANLVRLHNDLAAAREALQILASIWHHGSWKAETYNERELQRIMETLGHWPYKFAAVVVDPKGDGGHTA